MIKKCPNYAGISLLLMLAACSPQPDFNTPAAVPPTDTTGKLPSRYVYDEFAHKLVYVRVCNCI